MNADPLPPDPDELLPPPPVLRQRLAKAMRDVDILNGLLKLAERVSERDGRAVESARSQGGPR